VHALVLASLPPAFIIGCARSGTCWLGATLALNPGCHVTIEDDHIFAVVDEMAFYPERRAALMDSLLALYDAQLGAAGDRQYIDKSHQAIWLAEELAEAFPGARFIGIQRSPYAVVASMLGEFGILKQFWYWQRYPTPNRHIGASEEILSTYGELPLVAKCALKWQSHKQRMMALAQVLGKQLHVVNYEELVARPDAEIKLLEDFLARKLLPPPQPDRTRLDGWRRVLSSVDVSQIDEVLGDTDILARSA
jgi:hypothetical protein